MAVVGTQRWSDDALGQTNKEWTATLSWDVAGAFTEADAIAATVAPPGVPIPLINDAHPRSQYLRCSDRKAKSNGYGCWIVTASYATGNFSGDPNNPLNDPPELKVVIGSETEQREVAEPNAAGVARVLMNAAGDFFEGGTQREVATLQIIYSRNEPFFSLSRSMTYSMKLNSRPVTIAGAGTADAGQMLCRCIAPAKPLRAADPYIRMEYTFDFRAGKQKDQDGAWDGFKTRLLNQGFNGWWNNAGTIQKDKFYMPGSTSAKLLTPSTPILLDANGIPIDTSAGYVVGPQCKPAVAYPGAASFGRGITLEIISDGGGNTVAVWIHYLKYSSLDLNNLAL